MNKFYCTGMRSTINDLTSLGFHLIRNFFPILFAAIILNSCSQYYYTPNSENVPLLTKKNEVAGAINFYPPSDGGVGIEFQTAYAAGNHLAIQGNFGGGSGSYNSAAHGGGGYFEGGVGYFLPFGPRKRFVFESFGIFSLGWMNTTYTSTSQSDDNGSINAGMTRLAIQPSIGYKAKHFEMAFSLRAGGVNYSNVSGDLVLSDAENNKINQVDYLKQNKNQFFVEPAITVKVGGPSKKGQLQIGGSTDLTNGAFSRVDSWLSIGLNFNIYAKKKTN